MLGSIADYPISRIADLLPWNLAEPPKFPGRLIHTCPKCPFKKYVDTSRPQRLVATGQLRGDHHLSITHKLGSDHDAEFDVG